MYWLEYIIRLPVSISSKVCFQDSGIAPWDWPGAPCRPRCCCSHFTLPYWHIGGLKGPLDAWSSAKRYLIEVYPSGKNANAPMT